MKRLWLVLGAAVAMVTVASPSRAHDPFEITAVARVSPDGLAIEATMARSTALRLATGDTAPRATFAPEAFPSHRAQIERAAPSLYALTSQQQPLRLRGASARLSAENDVEVLAEYERPSGSHLSVSASHLSILPEGYTSALSVVQSGSETVHFKLLTAADPVLEIPLAEVPNAPSVPAADGSWKRFERFVALGAEHVLTGYDHLLFLFGVLIACRTVRNMLAVVTSFTVAHSLTLFLAVFGHVSVPGRIVEPLIALSIVFVGIENLRGQPGLRHRVAVTFAFGLVHGLGFAGALGALELDGGSLPLTLFSFNLGVELGQLAVAALALPLLSKLNATRHGHRGLRFSSVLLSATGLFWFVERVA